MRGDEASPTTLLTGSTGFIGTGIRAALARAARPTRLLARSQTSSREDVPAGFVSARADLTDVGSIYACLDGISTVIHAASYVGNDRELQWRVNVEGTRNLVEAAARHQVPNLVYVSTFGVYGGDYVAGAAEIDIAPRPRSPLSASRWAAELIVLDHGGTVIRPALVHGPGDKWVIPPLIKLILSLDAWIDDGAQLVSTIGRDRLGELIVALIGSAPGSGVFHAAHRDPIQIRQLAVPVIERLGRKVPTASLTVARGKDALKHAGVGASAMQLLTSDSWINSEKIWATSRLSDSGHHALHAAGELDGYFAQLTDIAGP